MSWQDIMRRILPSIGGASPEVRSPYGDSNRPCGSTNPHRGVDFTYRGSGFAKLNQSHPAIRSPVAGIVTNAGQGQYGTIAIRDANGFSHEILHTHSRHVAVGDPVAAGQLIGTMGNTGVESGASHVHYQLKDPSGKADFPHHSQVRTRGRFASKTADRSSRNKDWGFKHQSEMLAYDLIGTVDSSGPIGPWRCAVSYVDPQTCARCEVLRPATASGDTFFVNFVDSLAGRGGWRATRRPPKRSCTGQPPCHALMSSTAGPHSGERAWKNIPPTKELQQCQECPLLI